jgi:hypothetical protein
MELNISESLRTIILRDSGHINGPMEESSQVIGKTIRCMAREYSSGLMVDVMKVVM